MPKSCPIEGISARPWKQWGERWLCDHGFEDYAFNHCLWQKPVFASATLFLKSGEWVEKLLNELTFNQRAPACSQNKLKVPFI